MSANNGEKSLLGKLITWFVMILLAVAALKLGFWLFGIALGIGGFLLFTVAPIAFVIWLVMKCWKRCTRK